MSSIRDWCPKCDETGWGCKCRKVTNESPTASIDDEAWQEALKPFAQAYENQGDGVEWEDRTNIWEHPAALEITLGDLRRASEAVKAIVSKAPRIAAPLELAWRSHAAANAALAVARELLAVLEDDGRDAMIDRVEEMRGRFKRQAEDAFKAIVSEAPRTDCPSCGGLNTSCPVGCGRDPKTGELDGSTLALG